MMNKMHWLTSLAVGGLMLSGQAFAHAHISSATPAEGARIAAPKAVSVTFTEGLELPFSGLTLSNAAGKSVPLGDTALKQDGKTLTAPVSKSLKAGEYAVEWHVLSKDGHKTEGHYQFTVTP